MKQGFIPHSLTLCVRDTFSWYRVTQLELHVSSPKMLRSLQETAIMGLEAHKHSYKSAPLNLTGKNRQSPERSNKKTTGFSCKICRELIKPFFSALSLNWRPDLLCKTQFSPAANCSCEDCWFDNGNKEHSRTSDWQAGVQAKWTGVQTIWEQSSGVWLRLDLLEMRQIMKTNGWTAELAKIFRSVGLRCKLRNKYYCNVGQFKTVRSDKMLCKPKLTAYTIVSLSIFFYQTRSVWSVTWLHRGQNLVTAVICYGSKMKLSVALAPTGCSSQAQLQSAQLNTTPVVLNAWEDWCEAVVCCFTDTKSCDTEGAGLCSHLVSLVRMCLAFLISLFIWYWVGFGVWH